MSVQNNNVINGNCWVAYFDILGFKKLMNNFSVRYVRNVLKQAINTGKSSNIECKFVFFSDSFAFYTEDDSVESFYCIEGTSAIFFHAMFLGKGKIPPEEIPKETFQWEKIPMRGCLNVGRFYADEKDRIFFGPALIEAIDCAEGQNWIGFILSEKTRKRLASFESVGIKPGYEKRYVEYEVPFKKVQKQRKLLAYNLNLSTTIGNTEWARNQQNQLWAALDYMKYMAQMLSTKEVNQNADVEKCSDYEEIITKYENTKNFLFSFYPWLEERKTS